MNGKKTETRNIGDNVSSKKDGKREMAKIRRSETRREEYKAKYYQEVDKLQEIDCSLFMDE